MSFLQPIIQDLVPNELKDIRNLAAFKNKIKKWSLEKCLLGFVKFILGMLFFLKKREVDADFFSFKNSYS